MSVPLYGTSTPGQPSVSVSSLFRTHAPLQLSAALCCISVVTSISFCILSPEFECEHSFELQHRLLQAWISGGAFSALLLLVMAAITSRRMHHDVCTWYCLFILLNSTVRFMVACTGREHLVCVTPLGGMGSGPTRGYSILTFVFWTTSAPTTLALLATLSGSVKDVVPSFFWALCCLLAGSIGTFFERAIPWTILELASVAADFVVISFMWTFARRGLARAQDHISRALWVAVSPIAIGTWLMIPTIWLLCQLDMISHSVQSHLINIFDFSVKLAFVILNIGELQVGDSFRDDCSTSLAAAVVGSAIIARDSSIARHLHMHAAVAFSSYIYCRHRVIPRGSRGKG